jgi:prepilin-type N-terminal cleavage/methylation domain-containing protein
MKPAPANRPGRRGFTLAELLIVITVIVLLFTIAIPSMKTMLKSGGVEAASTIIGSATATVRAYSGRPTAFTYGDYQGTAMIFTPANEIRFTINDENTVDGSGNRLISKYPTEGGYVDIAGQAYINMPSNLGVVGITRGGTTAILQLFTPPFAIRFNSQGEMIARSATTSGASQYDGNVYYDGNGDGKCVESKTRNSFYASGASSPAATYDPLEWDPTGVKYPAKNDATTNAGIATGVATTSYEGKFKLPFEQIDTVVGVIFYSKSDFQAAGLSLAGSATAGSGAPVVCCAAADPGTWIMNNGKTFFFNRLTGAVLK